MVEVTIRSDNRDFCDTLSQAVLRELGVACGVAAEKGAVVQVGAARIEVRLPVRLRALLADIEAALQPSAAAPAAITIGKWRLSPLHKSLAYIPSGAESALTDKEINILQLLAENPGRLVDKETLLKTVWGMELALDTHTLETHIYRLRNKFRELAEDEVIVADGGGYKLEL